MPRRNGREEEEEEGGLRGTGVSPVAPPADAATGSGAAMAEGAAACCVLCACLCSAAWLRAVCCAAWRSARRPRSAAWRAQAGNGAGGDGQEEHLVD